MAERFNMHSDQFDAAIQIIESRSFLLKNDPKIALISSLCQMDYFKSLMRDPQLEHYLTPYMEEFIQIVDYKHIPRGTILYYEGEAIDKIYFVLRGSLAEFSPKSQEDEAEELYWDSQVVLFQEEQKQAEKEQLLVQEKKKRDLLLFERLQGMNATQQGKSEVISGQQLSVGVKQYSTTTRAASVTASRSQSQIFHSRSPSNAKKYRNTKTQLEEAFFSDEYKQKSTQLKSKIAVCVDASRLHSGQQSEELLKLNNPHQERHFKKGKCQFKISKVHSAGQCLGQIKRSEDRQQTSKAGNSIITCSSDSFVLTISQKDFQRIFENLTERLNFVFNVLSNAFPTAKKLILYDFSFQFTEYHFDLNQIVFHEGEPPASVHIMKTGELDYRKNLNLRGETIDQRICMIIEGEVFGHEDMFSTEHTHTVAACLNNTIIYSIPKEKLLLYQFTNVLKKASQAKTEFLQKKVVEICSKNTEFSPIMSTKHEKHKSLQGLSSLNSQSSNTSNKSPVSPLKRDRTSSQIRLKSKEILFHSNPPSFSHILSSDSSLNRNSLNYFSGIKNLNLGENDSDLFFQTDLKSEPISKHFSEKSSLSQKNQEILKEEDEDQRHSNRIQKFGIQQFATAGSGLKGLNRPLVTVIQTDRAQPQSVYSRIAQSEIEDKTISEKICQNSKETNARSPSINQRSPINRPEFKLNKLPKDLFALQVQINSDFKQKEKQNLLLHNINTKLKASSDTSSNQQSNSNPSINHYKEQTMEYFVKENIALRSFNHEQFENIFEALQKNSTTSMKTTAEQLQTSSRASSKGSFSELISPELKAVRPRDNSKEIASPSKTSSSSPSRHIFHNPKEQLISRESTPSRLQDNTYYVRNKDFHRRISSSDRSQLSESVKNQEKQIPLNLFNNFLSTHKTPQHSNNNSSSCSRVSGQQETQKYINSSQTSSRDSSSLLIKKRQSPIQNCPQDTQNVSFKLRDEDFLKKQLQSKEGISDTNMNNHSLQTQIKRNPLVIQDFMTEKQQQSCFQNILNFSNIRSSSNLRLGTKMNFIRSIRNLK